MDAIYGSVRAGLFTMVRYTHAQLSKQGTIEEIESRGLTVHLMGQNDRVIREPTSAETKNRIRSVDDLDTGLYQHDVNVPGGVSSLNDSGDVPNDNLPNPVLMYKGEWDPVTNNPVLLDGRGNSGDQYRVINCPTEIGIDLGSGEIKVENGDEIEYREGRYIVSISNDLSNSERKRLNNSMQRVSDPEIITPLDTVELVKGTSKSVQIMDTNAPRGEYHLIDAGGLTDVYLHAITGELHIRTDNDPVNLYKVIVALGTSLGQISEFEIFIDVMEG